MITSAILTLPIAFITFLLGLLPLYPGFSAGIVATISDFTTKMAGVASLFPMSTIKIVVGAILATEIAIFLFHASAWVFHWRQR